MIRPATPADLTQIQTCARLAYAPYIPRIGREPAPMVADFATQIAAGHVHVATDDTRVLGFIVSYHQGDHVLLENVAIHPDAAGRGLGKALIAQCEAAARQQGATSIRLYTNAKMTENLAIYPRLGYVETDRRTEDGFDRVYFEKPLR